MDENNQEKKVDPATTGEDTTGNNEPKTEPTVPSQDKKFTKRERLQFQLQKIQEQLAEDEQEDESRPATMGDLKKIKQEEVRKSALELALQIEDVDEKNEVVKLLSERIIPSENPAEDFKLARETVNAKKAMMIAEEQNRKGTPATHASMPGAPGTVTETFTPTPEEVYFMNAFNLSKEKILEARKATQANQQ